MNIRDKLKILLHLPKSIFYSFKYNKPNIMSREKTIEYIRDNGLSLSRYGDGEFNIMLGVGIKFQKNSDPLRNRLIEIVNDKESTCLIGIPGVFCSKKESYLDTKAYKWWKRYVHFTKGYWYKFFRNNLYGDSLMTRFYLESKNKTDDYIMNYIKNLKSLWCNRNVVFVEGMKTRLGMGNDLFDNAKSIRRILCPNKNAFEKYEKILSTVLQHTVKDDLIICALGPTASILTYDLSKNNRQALDLGHFDIEYEWYLRKATFEENIVGKDTSESNQDFVENTCLLPDNVIAEIL